MNVEEQSTPTGEEPRSEPEKLWRVQAAVSDATRRARTAWIGDLARGVVLIVDADRDFLEHLAKGADSVLVIVPAVERAEALQPVPDRVTVHVVAPETGLPIDDGAVDVAIWLDAAGAAPIVARRLDELARVTRPEGRTLVSSIDASVTDLSVERLAHSGSTPQRRYRTTQLMVTVDTEHPTNGTAPDEVYVVSGVDEGPVAVAEPVSSTTVAALTSAIADLEAHLAAVTYALRRADQENDRLREGRELLLQLQTDAAEAVELRVERKLFALEIADLETRNEAALEQIESLGRRVRDLEASTSWKVTAPLRRVTGAVRR